MEMIGVGSKRDGDEKVVAHHKAGQRRRFAGSRVQGRGAEYRARLGAGSVCPRAVAWVVVAQF